MDPGRGVREGVAAAAAVRMSSNTRKLLKALSDMLLVPETKARMARQVGSRLRLLVGEGSCLLLDLREAEAASAVVQGDTKTEVDAVLSLSDPDFALVCAGELAPGQALMTGRLVVRGNLVRAMKCGPVFDLLRPLTAPPPPLPPPPPQPLVPRSSQPDATAPLARL